MKINCRRTASVVSLLFLVALVTSSPLFAKPPKTEDELIRDLSAAKDSVVTETLQKLEKEYPDSPKALPVIKGLLKDSREKVRRKAARVLGVWHTSLDQDSLKEITVLLKSSDPAAIMDGLKALSGVRATSTVPEILPLLQHSDAKVVRDACRALAVLGGKSVIKSIEPLLNSPDMKIKKDAEDAIFQLNQKA